MNQSDTGDSSPAPGNLKMLHNISSVFTLNPETETRLAEIRKYSAVLKEDLTFLLELISYLVGKLKSPAAGGSTAANILSKASQFIFAEYQVDGFEIKIERVDSEKNLWSVRSGNYRLSNEHRWSAEPMPANRTEFFIQKHSFTFNEVLQVAEVQVQKQRAHRLTKRVN